MPDVLSPDDVATRLVDLSGWSRDGNSIVRTVQASSFLAGIELVQQVSVVAEQQQHHPDIDIRYTTLTFRLSTHSEGGITEKDFALAERIDAAAASA